MLNKILILVFTVLLFQACKKESSKSENMAMDAAAPESFVSSSAAVENKKDSTRQFIRSADLKFRVKDVIRSTYGIENSTVRHGGFVTYTNLASTISYASSTRISEDSIREDTYFIVNNIMTLRVPNTQLDTLLKEIAHDIEFMDYRIIKADDVALNLLTNDLTQKRNSKNEDRLRNAIDNKGQRLREIAGAEESIEQKQEKRDAARVANLSLKDQINFSTVNINLYQRQSTKTEILAHQKSAKEYESGFGSKLLDSMRDGWLILETLILFLVQFWALFIAAAMLYFLYRKYKYSIFKKK